MHHGFMKTIDTTLQLPTPHSREQEILMKAFVTPGLVELWCACGTKFGKSLGASGGMIGAAWVKRQGLYRWVAPIYKQAKIGMKYHEYLLPDGTYDVNKSEPSVTINNNQTKIEYVSGKHPEDLEGEGITGGYCLDEAAKMSRQVYDSAKTTLTITRAPLAAFSTPKGKNWFFDKCQEARLHMEWALKKGVPPKKIFITAPSRANPAVTQDAIEEARQSLPERLFRQYYDAEFSDNGTVFIGVRDCIFGEVIELRSIGGVTTWTDPDAKKSSVVLGVDWAKKEDFTVFTAISLDSPVPKMVGFQRFQGLSYTEAIKQLIGFARNFKKVVLGRHDRTGVGEALDDMLAGTHLPFEGVIFTNMSKTGMVSALMLTFERKDILIPNIPELLYELDSYEVQTSASGNMRYAAPLGMHDDIVSALMLANDAVQEMRGGFEIRALEDLPKSHLSLDKFYGEMIQEIEDES